MAKITPTSLQPATSQEISQLRDSVERQLGIILTPVSEQSVLLSNKEKSQVHTSLERRGFTISEVKAGQDLGYIARSCDLEGQTACLRGCEKPDAVSHFAGQRFALHALNALEYNLRIVNRLIVPKHSLAEDATNAFFMGKTPTELGTDDPITKYAREGLADKLREHGVSVSDSMKELDSKRLLVAVDLEGYKLLSNRLGIPFIKKADNWCLIAACPPPRQFIHILGEIHEGGLPKADYVD